MTIADSLTLLNNTKTAIAAAIEAKGIPIGSIPFADYPGKIVLIEGGSAPVEGGPQEWSAEYYDTVYSNSAGSWSRPEWRSLPTVEFTDQKFIGLHTVHPEDGNFCALSATGNYTVDWGDGIVEDFASGVQANHLYEYTNVALSGTDALVTFSASTNTIERVDHGFENGKTVALWNLSTIDSGIVEGQLYYVANSTSDNFQITALPGGSIIPISISGSATLSRYKQAIVTVTPQEGSSLTSLNLNVNHPQIGALVFSTGWLDIILGSPNLSTLTFRGTTLAEVNLKNALERIRIVNLGAVQSLASAFFSFENLKVVELPSSANNLTNTSGLFQSCVSLVTLKLFNTSNVIAMLAMFRDCIALKTVPLFDIGSATTVASMFYGCTLLETVPAFNMPNVTSINSMFQGCVSLKTTPAFNTPIVSTADQAFFSCSNLEKVSLFNTQSVTNMSAMFSGCRNLQEVPPFNTQSVTDMFSMFNACISLKTIPLFNTQAVTTMTSMFSGCTRLETVPLFNTQAVTTMSGMFTNCISLKTVPLFNTQIVTTMSGMFTGCISLESVPLFNTQIVTSMSSMFSGCTSLETVPLFNTQSVTNMSSMFRYCDRLQRVPAFNTTAVTSVTTMFGNCSALGRIQATGFRYSISIASCRLSSTALNEFYTNLPAPVSTARTITVTGNFGTVGDDPTIATAKGWTVTG